MKFILPPEPKYGETRIRYEFLFFPMEINKEVRWFEFACWLERWADYSYDLNLAIDAKPLNHRIAPVKHPRSDCYWKKIEWK